MMKKYPMIFRTAALLVCLVSVLATSNAAQAILPDPLAKLLNEKGIPPSSISILIKEAGASIPLVSHLADTPRNPASTMKLLTTIAALDLLGPSYRWETKIYLNGTLKAGTLKGDLVLKGSGDPWFVIERFWKLLKNLRAQGLKHIDGDLVIDDHLFDQSAVDTHTLDGQAFRAYNTPPGAALINFSATRIVIRPALNRLTVRAEPPTSTLQIKNKVRVLPGACAGRNGGITITITAHSNRTEVTVGGQYPPTCGEVVLVRSVQPHHQYIYGVFRHLWEEMGGSLAGTVRKGTAAPGNTEFLSFPSVPLGQIVTYINKFSNNVMSRNLLLTLAAEHNGASAKPEQGIAVVQRWLNRQGLELEALNMINGAGLSRQARLTARGLADLLEHAYYSAFASELKASLPLAGYDGSARRYFRDVATKGKLRLKTGRLKHVRAIAGFAETPDNRNWIVVILHHRRSTEPTAGFAVHQNIVKWLYSQR
ncbi:MAG: D-alanyl-D-alanine carboxypeptidase/D-alanyl-D-alanine-endopeptidase [Pseudomonadota bacterium]|nr:D-alanyl-D-alanine carboxypeptidase/D-alanyl-D-alanine-endopeptidase [Pseudomonadota bacterium]